MKPKTFTVITCLLFLLPSFLLAQKFKLLSVLNSESRETNLSISPNGKYLYYMSDQGGQPWSTFRRNDPDDNHPEYDGDIWYSENIDGEWQKPICLSKKINTYSGEDEPNVTVDGQAVYFQSWRDDWQSSEGPYYKAELDGNVWKNSVGLGGEITRFFTELSDRTHRSMIRDFKKMGHYDYYLSLLANSNEKVDEKMEARGVNMRHYWFGTDGMAVAPNEKFLIISTFIPEKKKHDLYISYKNSEGIWTYPKPLNINSDFEEISVFIAGDNKTIYFASDRPGGFGKKDVYKTTLIGKNKCGEVTNLGKPYNSEKDEYGFIVNSSEDTGFMVSDGDIVQVDLNEEAKPLEIVIINGRVINEQNEPLSAEIELVEKGTNESLGTVKSNKNTGEFSFSFERKEGSFIHFATGPSGKKVESPLLINEKTDNVIEHTIVIASSESTVLNELQKKDFQVGETLRVDRLYFEANKAKILEESFPVLDGLALILQNRKDLILELGGHTNGLPDHQFCDRLSKERAKSVYDYLMEKGLSSDYLRYKGYGKRRPIATNKTLQGRRINQRVEIKVLEIKQ